MNQEMENRLADLRARQEAGEKLPCPRCGRDTMKPALHTNALSRRATGVYVCDDCGTSEAMLEFMNNPMPVEEWAIFNPPPTPSEINQMDGKKAWEYILAHYQVSMVRLYARWLEEKPDADFRPYRQEAMRCFPGMKQIWERPFQIVYDVADGELIVRLKKENGSIRITADLAGK